MKSLARALAALSVVLGGLVLYHPRQGQSRLLVAKLLACALAAYGTLAGMVGTTLSLIFRMPNSFVVGALGTLVLGRYFRRVTAPHDEMRRAFGPDWEGRISPEAAPRMLARRWTWWLRTGQAAGHQRDVVFAIVPDSGRPLLCDVWQPPKGITPTGLVFIYLHGGYWHFFDKDTGTRTFFRHLAGQGHVVMDVAHRLSPEVALPGMMGDVLRAILWMKENSEGYGVNPGRGVIGGASSGAHLALLAGYATGHPRLIPNDLRGADLSVRAVVSYYGSPDLRPAETSTGEVDVAPPGRTMGAKSSEPERPATNARGVWMAKDLGTASSDVAKATRRRRARVLSREQLMVNLLGGPFQEIPEMYAVASPITHVKPGCPPTLIFQGEHDSLVPVDAARALHHKLVEAGVPVVYVELPRTEHAFDLILPRISPPAQSSFYDLDRFLALMTG